MQDEQIKVVLAKLDEEIDAAEARLAELRAARKGAEAFVAFAERLQGGSLASAEPVPSKDTGKRRRGFGDSAQHGIVLQVIRENGLTEFTTSGIREEVVAAGHDFTPTQVSNALVALRRKGFVEPIPGPRGRWRRVPNTIGPAEAGPIPITSLVVAREG